MTGPPPDGPRARLLHILDDTRVVFVACAAALSIGLFFLLVWSPLPWGWLGIDHYDDRARRLASGAPFDTTDVPWGYAYYLAAFYALFGPIPWIPLLVQVLLNALTPWLLYRLVEPLAGQRVAALSALLAGIFSFNTAYAATQSSDAVCTVLFLTSLLLFDRGRSTAAARLFAGSGALGGIAAQFRPNLVLFAPFLAGCYLLGRPRVMRKVAQMAIYVGATAAVLVPWTLRNFELTGSIMPTSTHGGIQLWYGTLQVGPYLESRTENPRSAFAISAFDYTSLAGKPIVVSAMPQSCAPMPITLIYWTDRDPAPKRLDSARREGDRLVYELQGEPSHTTISYYFESAASEAATPQWTPPEGPADPLTYIVSTEHLGDLDWHDRYLDIFDLVRLARWVAWRDAPPRAELLDLDDDGRVGEGDLARALVLLAEKVHPGIANAVLTRMDVADSALTLVLQDGSTLRVPHAFTGRVTDLDVNGSLAASLTYARRSFHDLRTIGPSPDRGEWCGAVSDVQVNQVFYRDEPHLMARYMALALDNIRRTPAAFAAATLYRLLRLFVIRGSDDPRATQQFAASRWVYRLGALLSLTYFLLFLAGVWVAWRRRYRILPLVLPVIYVPITIAFVLTNMRYTVTVQPYIFTFIAVAVLAALEPRPRRPR